MLDNGIDHLTVIKLFGRSTVNGYVTAKKKIKSNLCQPNKIKSVDQNDQNQIDIFLKLIIKKKDVKSYLYLLDPRSYLKDPILMGIDKLIPILIRGVGGNKEDVLETLFFIVIFEPYIC
jgi:hypothetical protein